MIIFRKVSISRFVLVEIVFVRPYEGEVPEVTIELGNNIARKEHMKTVEAVHLSCILN